MVTNVMQTQLGPATEADPFCPVIAPSTNSADCSGQRNMDSKFAAWFLLAELVAMGKWCGLDHESYMPLRQPLSWLY